MDKNAKHYPLNVTMPQHCAYVVRDLPQATVEQRERALNATHWNEFAFPSGMLTVDMLSDSGTTAMTNQQWATLFLGDEAYGRNTGYYVLLIPSATFSSAAARRTGRRSSTWSAPIAVTSRR